MTDGDDDPAFLAEMQRRAATPIHHRVRVSRRHRATPARPDRTCGDWTVRYAQLNSPEALDDLLEQVPAQVEVGHINRAECWVEVFLDRRLDGIPDDLADPYARLADLAHALGGHIAGRPEDYGM